MEMRQLRLPYDELGPMAPFPNKCWSKLPERVYFHQRRSKQIKERTYLQTSFAVCFDRPGRRLNRHGWGLHLIFKSLRIIKHSWILPIERRADAQSPPERGSQAERPVMRSAIGALFFSSFEYKRRRGCKRIGLWRYTFCHWVCFSVVQRDEQRFAIIMCSLRKPQQHTEETAVQEFMGTTSWWMTGCLLPQRREAAEGTTAAVYAWRIAIFVAQRVLHKCKNVDFHTSYCFFLHTSTNKAQHWSR